MGLKFYLTQGFSNGLIERWLFFIFITTVFHSIAVSLTWYFRKIYYQS